ncbi:DUF4333 domain-containing protein [Aquihabitans sp. G128]|uniref:DUF4333 domain-containing protein n=1 Tax=Aquihabitans sp. G128 TaxID=2849779 RepID=UPI001C22E5C0|nr:DUF4333 domain-containing protein [Aquihabitans sp. G128]QXC63251.1 DUF4333 domain-containing protein [Aquihabitans sp. G128]
MRSATFARVLLALALVLGVAAGCSRTKQATTLDTDGTERAIDKVIGSRIEPDVKEVRCPADIARGKGRSFSCRALLEGTGGEVRLRVRQVDADGTLDVDLLDAVVDRKAVATDLRRQLVKRFLRTFTVDCGTEAISVVAPGSTFTCSAKDPAGKRTITVTVTDAAGTVSYDIAEK